jgi:staphylococcal nuclease domain-containing protein 1
MLNEICIDRELVANIDFTDARDNNLLWVTLMDPKQASTLNQSINAEVVSEGLAMVPKKLRPFERAAGDVIADLKKREAEAKSGRLGMWEFGDLSED